MCQRSKNGQPGIRNNVRKNIKGGEDCGKGECDGEKAPGTFYHVHRNQLKCCLLTTDMAMTFQEAPRRLACSGKAAYRFPACHTYNSMMKSGSFCQVLLTANPGLKGL